MATDNYSVSFSGHRKERILQNGNPLILGQIQLAIIEQVEQLYGKGYKTFYCGMAQGFDLLAASAVIACKWQFRDIRLVAVVPFRNQAARYEPLDKIQYGVLLREADEVTVLSESYYRGCFHRRNDYMINKSHVIVTYWDGVFKGGTFYTVRKAQQENKQIINLFK
jgi:hypothetical protein